MSVRVAPLIAALVLFAGCGTVRPDAPAPRPAPRPAPAPERPTTPRPRPPVERPTPPAPAPRPVPPPDPIRAPAGSIAAELWYPAPRIATWTLASGVRVLFRRTDDERGVVRVRAYALGGWLGADGPRGFAAAVGASGETDGVQTTIGAADVRLEGTASRRELPALLGAVGAAIERRRTMPWGAPTPEALLDAALAGIDPRDNLARAPEADVTRIDEALLGRPDRFVLLVSGDVPADTLEALAGRALGRLRAGVMAPPTDSLPPVASRGMTLAISSGGLGTPAGEPRALVGFRGVVSGATASRSPDDVQAGLDVLAAALVAAVERAAPNVRVEARAEVAGNVATVIVEATGGGLDAQALGALVLRAAGDLGTGEAALGVARGAAVNRARSDAPDIWLDRLAVFARGRVDPRNMADYAGRLRAVPAERVRLLADAVIDPARAVVVEVGGRP